MNMRLRQCASVVAMVTVATGIVARAAVFDPLFQLGRVVGTCLVKRPGVAEFEVGVQDRAYPYGSTLQTADGSEAVVHLSSSKQLRLGAATTVRVSSVGEGLDVTVVEADVEKGILSMFLPDAEKDAVIPLTIRTPVAALDNLRGRAELRLHREAENFRLVVETAIGGARITGPQFGVERLRRSSAVEIVTAYDESYTGLTGKSGEFEVMLERGSDEPLATGFRPGARVRIWRRRAALSDKLAVSVMISGAEGGVQASFAYLQGEAVIEADVKAADQAAAVAGAAVVTPDADDASVTGTRPNDGGDAAGSGVGIADDVWNF